MSVSSLPFPSQENIAAYLGKHTLTKELYLKNNEIIQAVARCFADQDKAPAEVDTGVRATMLTLSKKLKLPSTTLIMIQINLAEALKDCAKDNAIKVVSGG